MKHHGRRVGEPGLSLTLKRFFFNYWPLFVIIIGYSIIYLFWKNTEKHQHGNANEVPFVHSTWNLVTTRSKFPHEPDPWLDDPYQFFDIPAWKPSKFHSSSSKWKECGIKPATGFSPIDPFNPSGLFDGKRPILVYTWHSLDDWLYVHQESLQKCPVPCYFASKIDENDPDCMDEVDAFIFHPPTEFKKADPPYKRRYQQWVIFTTETEENYPVLKDPRYRRKFDINMTYHLDDQVPYTYFIDMAFYFDYFPEVTKKSEPLASIIISNCFAKTNRNKDIEELQKLLPIDAYGRCNNNKEFPEDLVDKPWWESKWNITSQYKFVIAFENSEYTDYVSEKLFHAFVAGSIPGAPNVDEFTPSSRSIIRASDFSSLSELAEYMRYLSDNPDKYAEYFKWKQQPPNNNFLKLQKTSPRTGPCRLCMEVAKMQNKL